MGQREQMKIEQLRAIAARLLRGEPTEPDLVGAAQDKVREMCCEGSAHGLTEAEVIRAVLIPLFEKKQGCGCPTCQARRNHPANEQSRHYGMPVP